MTVRRQAIPTPTVKLLATTPNSFTPPSSGHYDYDVSDFAVASPDFTVGTTGSAEGNLCLVYLGGSDLLLSTVTNQVHPYIPSTLKPTNSTPIFTGIASTSTSAPVQGK